MIDLTLILRYFGAAIGMGLGAIGSGVGEGHAAAEALEGIARQPGEERNLLKQMLVGQAMSETPGIFALVIAVLLVFWHKELGSSAYAFACIGAGLAVGLSGIGAGYGIGFVGAKACQGIARQPESGGRMMITMILGQALATSPSIFGLVVSLMLVLFNFGYNNLQGAEIYSKSAAVLSAGLCMGAGAIGPGLGIGYTGGMACESFAKNMKYSGLITRTMFIGAAVAESTSIYSFVIASILLFFS